jgi:hypothetical protein
LLQSVSFCTIQCQILCQNGNVFTEVFLPWLLLFLLLGTYHNTRLAKIYFSTVVIETSIKYSIRTGFKNLKKVQQFIHRQREAKAQVKRSLKINKLPPSDSVIVSRNGHNLELLHFWKNAITLQGHWNQIDRLNTNNFSWLNESLVKRQHLLGSWNREIWYKTIKLAMFIILWSQSLPISKIKQVFLIKKNCLSEMYQFESDDPVAQSILYKAKHVQKIRS